MAVTAAELSGGTSKAMGSFTMSLFAGWDEIPPELGGRLPAPGDLVVLEVRRPQAGVIGPSSWTRHGNVFWRLIGPREIDPVFYAAEAAEWDVRGYAIEPETLAPLDGNGSFAVPES